MTKRWKGRLLGAVAAGALAASMVPAMALGVGASVLDSTATDADPAGPGYSITLSGLEKGDSVSYYQIIRQDLDNGKILGTQQWKLTAAVDRDNDGIVDGTENVDFGHKDADGNSVNGLHVEEMVISDYTTNADGDEVTSDTRHLTPKIVNAVSAAVTNNKAEAAGSTSADADGGITFTPAENKQGMYMFIAVPAEGANYIYKPIFASTDYYNVISIPEDNTHALNVDSGDDDEYGNTIGVDYPATQVSSGPADDAGVFKRSPLTVDKKSGTYNEDGSPVDIQNDVAVGDTVNFTITFPIPTYSKNYLAPQYYITDTLTEGLILDPESIEVTVKDGDTAVTVAKDKDYRVFTKSGVGGGTVSDAQYYNFKNTVPSTSTFNGFVVQFLNDNPDEDGSQDGFLHTVTGAPTATVTYQAKVTTTDSQKFAQQINQMDNTVKLNYSNDPNFVPDGYTQTTTKEVPKLDENGYPVPKTDEDGNPVYDEDGNPVYETEEIEVPKLDENGNPLPDPNSDFDSNDPGLKDENGAEDPTSELTDKTRHYTFDIDADVLGRDQSINPETGQPYEPGQDEESDHDKTSEIRKIFVDANGKVIQEKETSKVVKGGTEENGNDASMEGDDYGWLEGAEFTLTKVKNHVTTYNGANGQTGTEEFQPADADLPKDQQTEMKFNASTHILDPNGVNPTSDAKGYISMKGLDAGEYILKEIKAPLGYAYNPNVQYRITITPTYVMEPGVPPTADDGKGGADDAILESYEVKIVCQKLDSQMNIISGESVETISTYNVATTTGEDAEGNQVTYPASTLKEDGTQDTTVTIDKTVQSFGSNETAMIMNKKLGLLPATGGSGIFFYLFVGGAIALVSYILIRKLKKASKPAA